MVSLSGGCFGPCTLIGCQTVLEVRTTATLPARYQVELSLDLEHATFTCDTTGAATGTNGVVLGETQLSCGPEGLEISASPTVVSVRFLADDGTLLGEASFAPDYEEHYPNGEACGGACETAAVEVETVPAS